MYVTVSGHVGQNLHVYNVNDNKLLKRLDTNHTGGKSSALSKPQSHNLLNFVKRELGVMDVTHSPCGGKLVTVSMDKYAHVFDVSDWNVDDVASKYASITAKRIICKIATAKSWSNTQVVLTWALQRGVSVIPRSSKTKHIIDNSRIFDKHSGVGEGGGDPRRSPGTHGSCGSDWSTHPGLKTATAAAAHR